MAATLASLATVPRVEFLFVAAALVGIGSGGAGVSSYSPVTEQITRSTCPVGGVGRQAIVGISVDRQFRPRAAESRR